MRHPQGCSTPLKEKAEGPIGDLWPRTLDLSPHCASAPIAGIGLLSGTLPLPLGKTYWIKTE